MNKAAHKCEKGDKLNAITRSLANIKTRTNRDTFFDVAIGHIEDLLIDEAFQELQQSYLENHWQVFEEGEENKLCYMDIFLNYTNEVEEHITTHLQKNIPNFSMDQLIFEMSQRKNELEGEVFEVLYRITDFEAFKEMLLDYRKMKTCGDLNLSSALSVKPITMDKN